MTVKRGQKGIQKVAKHSPVRRYLMWNMCPGLALAADADVASHDTNTKDSPDITSIICGLSGTAQQYIQQTHNCISATI